MLKAAVPDREVTGIDPDPTALQIARKKAFKAGREIRFDNGVAQEFPYPDESCDKVFYCLVFHHLNRGQKEGALLEVHRVLRRGGEFT